MAQNNQKEKKQLINTDKEPKLTSKKIKLLFDGKTLNKDTVYEFDYYLIVGDLNVIRARVYKLKKSE